MKAKYMLPLTTLITVLALLPSKGRAELLNSGFEDVDSKGNPISWKVSTENYEGGGSITVDSDVKHEGSSSLKINQSDDFSYGVVSQDILVDENKDYVLSAFAKVADIQGMGAGARLFVSDAESTEELGHLDISSSEWEQVKLPFNSGNHSKIRVRCYLHKVSGTVWFDDLTLE